MNDTDILNYVIDNYASHFIDEATIRSSTRDEVRQIVREKFKSPKKKTIPSEVEIQAGRPSETPYHESEPHSVIMEVKHAYNRLLDAEKAFADAIDGFYSALADDPKMRNHPRRPVYGSKVMNCHNHVNFVNMMADLQMDMEGDGFLYMD